MKKWREVRARARTAEGGVVNENAMWWRSSGGRDSISGVGGVVRGVVSLIVTDEEG